MLNKSHLKFVVVCSLVISYCPFLVAMPHANAASIAVTSYHVDSHAVPQILSVVGKLKASESVDIASEVLGKVVFIRDSANKNVTKGDLLVKIDDRKAINLLSVAQANLNKEQRKLRDLKKLIKKKVDAKSAVYGQQLAFDIAKANYAAAKLEEDNHSIRAPFSGEIGLTNFSIGKLVKAGDELFTLDALSVMHLDLEVPEQYLAQLTSGLNVSVTTNAWKNKTFLGQIIAINSRVDPETLTLRVRVKFKNDKKQLKPGMLMSANINFSPINEITIPSQAVEYLGTKRFVYVISHGVVKRTVVTLGQRVKNKVAIINGLAVGDEIVLQGLVNMHDGSKVRVLANDTKTNPNESKL
jgi:RND family efflux transporter MFP subunit